MKKFVTRREFIRTSAALAGMAALPSAAWAKGSVVGAIYPGTWDEAFRKIVAPALLKSSNINLDLMPLYAVEQIAKAKASRGRPDFDTFVLDPGPAATGLADGLFSKFDASKVMNVAKLQPGMVTEYGVPVAAQFVGIAYNPKKFKEPPKTWKDLFLEPYVSRLGLTGFQTTFGTVSIIEIAKQFGGSITNVDPFFAELKKVLNKVAVIGGGAVPARPVRHHVHQYADSRLAQGSWRGCGVCCARVRHHYVLHHNAYCEGRRARRRGIQIHQHRAQRTCPGRAHEGALLFCAGEL